MNRTCLLFLFFLSTTIYYSQVIIKERFEINPDSAKLLNKNLYELQTESFTPCEPYYHLGQPDYYYQTVWAGYWGSIDPMQQLFYIQDDFNWYFINSQNTYEIKIIEGSEYCTFRKLVPLDLEENMFEWIDIESTVLSSIPGDSLIGDGDIMIFDGVETFWNQYYQVRFNYITSESENVTIKITSSQGVTKYFHTMIVRRNFSYPESQIEFDVPNFEEFPLDFYPEPTSCITDPFMLSKGGDLPDYVRYNVELILEDSSIAILKKYPEGSLGEEYGFTFLSLSEYELRSVYFQSYAFPDLVAHKVTIRITPNGYSINPLDIELNILPNPYPPLKVEFDPKVIDPGDTSLIKLYERNLESSEYYPFVQGFDENSIEYSEVDEGQMYALYNQYLNPQKDFGDLLSLETGEMSDYLGYIEGDFAFVADEVKREGTQRVVIGAEAFIFPGGGIASKVISNDKDQNFSKKLSKKSNSNSIKLVPLTPKTYYGYGELFIGKGIEIMLGETKYLGLKKREEYGETIYKISEIPIDYGEEPEFPADADGWTWIKDKDVWSERPVDVEVEGASPVFFDWLYGDIRTSGSAKPTMTDLPDGMIRIIGRYWDKDKENNLKLFTSKTNEFNADTIEVKVIKPNKLGDSPYKITGPTYTDGVDKEYNLDSLIINRAGELGILPQVIKSIMNTESNHEPAYRYEPFHDLTIIQNPEADNNIKCDSTHIYWINSETDLGSPGIPIHNNVRDADAKVINYPGYVTAWDYYMKNQSFYDTSVYDKQGEKWNEYKVNYEDQFIEEGMEKVMADDSSKILADTSYITFLRDTIGGKGFVGTVAQTRIAASYGVMQLTYYSKIGGEILGIYDYPDNNDEFLPEYINIPPINVEWGSKHLLGKIRSKKVLGALPYLKKDTWPEAKGLELTYWEGLFRYNGKENYPNKIFSNVHKYLPE
jgi:hypothetical protein